MRVGIEGWRFPSAGTRVGVGTGHPYDQRYRPPASAPAVSSGSLAAS